MDANEFIRNCNAHTLEELAAYEGKHVAWSRDGKRILACGASMTELYEAIDRQRIGEYVLGFIPERDVSYLGGASLDL